MTFRVGDRVKYVGPNFIGCLPFDLIPPIPDAEYTVRDVGIIPGPGESAIRLNEIVNAPRRWLIGGTFELWMEAKFFRPIVDRKTDISIFTSMLNPSPEKVLDAVMFDTLADIYLSHKQWTS